MGPLFCVSVRFLDATFHGRRDGGMAEWPPSPLRLFQALARVAAATSPSATLAQASVDALAWLERQPPPTIVAPLASTSAGYRLSVPNNAMDIVARAWSRGNYSNTGDASEATHRTMKPVRPTRLLGRDAVHYVWALTEATSPPDRRHIKLFEQWAASLVAVGWGLDLVVGQARLLSDEEMSVLPGERWYPAGLTNGLGWRVPATGTVQNLMSRHEAFLARIGPAGFTPPPALAAYDTIDYRRGIDRRSPSIAAFSLLKLDTSGFRSFDTARSALTVAGMIRHLVKRAAQQTGWSEQSINAFVLGHGNHDVEQHVPVGAKRFAYFPLPSVERRGADTRTIGRVRRVLISSFSDDTRQEIEWARRALSGQELIEEIGQTPTALLGLLPATDATIRQYTKPAAQWATVTPVVLPGYDDPAHYRRRLQNRVGAVEQKQLLARLDDRVDALLRRAIVQAGITEDLAAHAELSWRKEGFWPGSDLADRYGVPDHLRRFPRYHVKIDWRDALGAAVAVPGPVCIGGGRFLGVGLCAAF